MKDMVGDFDQNREFHNNTKYVAKPIYGSVPTGLHPVNQVGATRTAEIVQDIGEEEGKEPDTTGPHSPPDEESVHQQHATANGESEKAHISGPDGRNRGSPALPILAMRSLRPSGAWAWGQ